MVETHRQRPPGPHELSALHADESPESETAAHADHSADSYPIFSVVATIIALSLVMYAFFWISST